MLIFGLMIVPMIGCGSDNESTLIVPDPNSGLNSYGEQVKNSSKGSAEPRPKNAQ